MNYNCLDFIPLGQRGMVLVLGSAGFIFFSHIDSTTDGSLQIHSHQLLGYCTDDQLGNIYSIGQGEPVIKISKLENGKLTLIGQMPMASPNIQMNCMTKFNGNIIIGTNNPNSLIEINMASLQTGQHQINGHNLGAMGRQGKTLGAIKLMNVSADGTLLAVLDQNNTAAVFRNQNLTGQKPEQWHDFKHEPTALCIISGQQSSQFALIGGQNDGIISYMMLGLQVGANQQSNLARGQIDHDPSWHQGHPDQLKQKVVAICNIQHCTPNGDQVVATIDAAGEVKIWQISF